MEDEASSIDAKEAFKVTRQTKINMLPSKGLTPELAPVLWPILRQRMPDADDIRREAETGELEGQGDAGELPPKDKP